MSRNENLFRKQQQAEKKRPKTENANAIDQRVRRQLLKAAVVFPVGAGLALLAENKGLINLVDSEPQTDHEWLLKAAKEFQVKPDADELKMWGQNEFSPLDPSIPTDSEVAGAELDRRAKKTVELMGKSKNILFKGAAATINAYINSNRLDFRNTATALSDHEAMDIYFLLQGNDITGRIRANANAMLRSYTSIYNWAFVLTHEADHLVRRSGFLLTLKQTNPSLSNQELIDKEAARFHDQETRLQEESLAAAQTAKAYIIQYALGERRGVQTQDHTFGVALAKAKFHTEDMAWKDLVKRNWGNVN